MVLEAISPRVIIRISPEIGKNNQSRLACILRLDLDCLPQLRAESVGAPNAFDVERIRSGVRDVDVMHGDPQQTGSNFPHQPARDVKGKLVGTGQCARVRFEIVDREPEDRLELLQLELIPAKLRGVKRRLVIVAEQMFVLAGA